MIGYTIYNATRPITYPSSAEFIMYYLPQLDFIKPELYCCLI